MTPQAADNSSVGSSWSNTICRRALRGPTGVVAAEQQHPVRPGRVDLAAAAPLPVRTSRCRTRVTIRLASSTRWNPSTETQGVGQGVDDGPAERRRRVDRHDLDPARHAANGRSASRRRRRSRGRPRSRGPGRSPRSRSSTSTAPPAATHPTVSVPADPAVTVLVDPEPADLQVVRVSEQHRGRVHRRRHRPPRHPEPPATSATARPESITASSTAALGRLVQRARAGNPRWPG